MIPGPPFVFGSLLVMCALLVSVFIPENVPIGTDLRHKQIGKLNYIHFKNYNLLMYCISVYIY